METIKDYSYGVIPLRKKGAHWKVFLINQIPRDGSLFWTFPKGHPEAGETHIQTARRELLEETGIIPDVLATEPVFTQAYIFTHDIQLVEKRVEYYLGFTSSDTYKIQEDEVKEAGWFSLGDARDLLTHDIAKELLDEVGVYLENNNFTHMKTIKCQECGGEFQAVEREEILKALYDHYMEAHPDVIPNATDAEKKTWMERFEKEWATAEEA